MQYVGREGEGNTKGVCCALWPSYERFMVISAPRESSSGSLWKKQMAFIYERQMYLLSFSDTENSFQCSPLLVRVLFCVLVMSARFVVLNR